jgi:carbamoyl-phosphate synthase small subunit
MFARFVKPAGFSASHRLAQQTRFLATVETSAGRALPATRARATPISHDRATFTIRV